MPNDPTWEETEEVSVAAPKWEETETVSPSASEGLRLDRDLQREELHRQIREARAEGIGDKAISGLVDLGQRIAYTASLMDPLSAVGRVINPYQQSLLPTEGVRKAIDFLDPFSRADVVPGSAGEGVKQFASETISGLAQPEAVAALATGKINPELPGRLFQPSLVKAVPTAIENLKEAETPAEAAKAALELGLTAGGAAGIEAHAAKVRRIKPIDLKEAKPETLPEEAAPATEAKPEAAPEVAVEPIAEQAKPLAIKQPWQMTKREFMEYLEKETGGRTPLNWVSGHRYQIDQAIKEGKTVPPEVLKDYPDLESEAAKPSPVEAEKVAEVPPPEAVSASTAEAKPAEAPAGELQPAISETKPVPEKSQAIGIPDNGRVIYHAPATGQKKRFIKWNGQWFKEKNGVTSGKPLDPDLNLVSALDRQLVRESKSEPPEIIGMGGAVPGEPQKAQIEQLTDAFKGIEARKRPVAERVQEAFSLGERFAGTKDLFSRALSGLKSSGDYLIGKWRYDEKLTDLLKAKGELSSELEKRGWRTRAWVNQATKAIPSKRDQAAIAKWIDAGGDRAELERGLAETKPQYKQAYQDALNLSGEHLTAAQNAQNYFEARLEEAVDAGVLKQGVEDYLHRIYEKRPDLAKKAIAYVQTGLLKANPGLTKKRVFQFDWEAEKAGFKPVQSFIPRLADYESSLSKAIAAREFIKKATTMNAEDGRPIIDIKGVGIPIEDPAGVREATLIKPQFNPQKSNVEGTENYRGDYVNKEFPALSKWKWVSSDAEGKPIFVQGDVAIHPDYVHSITSLLEPSRVRYGRYGKFLRPALGVSSTVKQTMLDLSGFHQVQITAHGLEHKVLPWKIVQDIDFNNPNVEGLLRGGITLGGEYYPASEGLVGASLSRHIPILGPLTEAYHQWLFQSYIPRIKMTMALGALERNRARYAGKLSEDQIMFKTAQQANSAFGELNYIMLERSKTAQDIARLILLAPDFLEARGRFAGEALTQGGKSKVPGFGNEQRSALLLGAMTMYITARIANKMIDDQYHFEPENAFSIVKDGHAYSLRTVQGDILHLLEKPMQFWLNRLNPVYGRTLLQLATGRDYFGRKRSVPETLWDSVSNMTPIALRHGRERKLWESIVNSFGIQARRYNDVDSAFKLAQKWKTDNGIAEKGEFIYDPDKDPLRPLKIALSHADDSGAASELKKLLDSGYNRGKLNAYFNRYANMPFTGSFSNDRKWLKTLSEDDLKTVQAAREHKKSIRDLYLKALGQYTAPKAQPDNAP